MSPAIAVATRGFRRVAGHAGRAREWLVYEAFDGAQLRARRVNLDAEQVFHRHRSGLHPLDGVGVIIAASAGDGFVDRMRRRGVSVALTAEHDPQRAARGWVEGRLAPPAPAGIAAWICGVRDRMLRHH